MVCLRLSTAAIVAPSGSILVSTVARNSNTHRILPGLHVSAGRGAVQVRWFCFSCQNVEVCHG